MFDGGCREPTPWWPRTIPANSACKEPAMTIDILPTIAHLIGAKLPEHIVDGKIFGLFLLRMKQVSPWGLFLLLWKSTSGSSPRKMETSFSSWLPNYGGKAWWNGGIPTSYSQAKIELSLFDLKSDIDESKISVKKILKSLRNFSYWDSPSTRNYKRLRPAGKI